MPLGAALSAALLFFFGCRGQVFRCVEDVRSFLYDEIHNESEDDEINDEGDRLAVSDFRIADLYGEIRQVSETGEPKTNDGIDDI